MIVERILKKVEWNLEFIQFFLFFGIPTSIKFHLL